ncbi:hypothetical protein GUJ93_ZPchr0002g24904 [Zizania palustris]|uniref:Uncharacterized protein n=1 Tax=Zizania palustris TaxID=103762 RepID=A0A8J5RVQ6_ZIZPA|nr:hypothetical protein GUJ93_ZPchr0002g24904 [Zizania palustris]KAG8059099.1 hypothetical protein GUJ93_ZPchr0002g24904 [Zizania palustris]
MVQDSNPAQDMIDITGHVVHEAVSYDKDVLEIKLPGTLVASDYGANFVKDVCVDEGVFPHRKISEEKMLDEKSSPRFDFLMVDARKYAHELKPETVLLPVALADVDNTMKQCDLEGNFDGDISEKKISLQELLELESAEESQQRLELENAEGLEHRNPTSSEISESHMPTLDADVVGQVSTDECCNHVGTASGDDELVTGGVSSNDNGSGSSATISDTTDSCDATAALEKPTPTVEATDSLCCSGESNEAGTAEARPDAAPTSTTFSDVQPSEKSNDAPDETAVAPSGADMEKKDKKPDNGGATDVHSFDRTDEENCSNATKDDRIGAHVGEQDLPENAKGKSRSGNGYAYPLEPCSFGPSIMCNPASTSGHIAYYSGNVSVRSDSSTTSTRSFAFPVLQMDWTASSPVRMAKAERRRIRRRRGWRRVFLCWKF